MKSKISLLLLVVFLIASCSNHKIPTPAISFDSSPDVLENAETGKLIKKEVCKENVPPTAMSYKQNWKFYTYLTSQGDTIKYFFIRDMIYDVVVKFPRFTFDQLKEEIDTQLQANSVGHGFYETDNLYFKLCQDGETGECSILYFTPEKRVKDIVKLIFESENPDTMMASFAAHLDSINAEALGLQFYLGLSGNITGEAMMYGGIPEGHYGHLLYDRDAVIAELEKFNSIFDF